MIETEIERLVVRLVGDSSTYVKEIDSAIAATEKLADSVTLNITEIQETYGLAMRGLSGQLRMYSKDLGSATIDLATKFEDSNALVAKAVAVHKETLEKNINEYERARGVVTEYTAASRELNTAVHETYRAYGQLVENTKGLETQTRESLTAIVAMRAQLLAFNEEHKKTSSAKVDEGTANLATTVSYITPFLKQVPGILADAAIEASKLAITWVGQLPVISQISTGIGMVYQSMVSVASAAADVGIEIGKWAIIGATPTWLKGLIAGAGALLALVKDVGKELNKGVELELKTQRMQENRTRTEETHKAIRTLIDDEEELAERVGLTNKELKQRTLEKELTKPGGVEETYGRGAADDLRQDLMRAQSRRELTEANQAYLKSQQQIQNELKSATNLDADEAELNIQRQVVEFRRTQIGLSDEEADSRTRLYESQLRQLNVLQQQKQAYQETKRAAEEFIKALHEEAEQVGLDEMALIRLRAEKEGWKEDKLQEALALQEEIELRREVKRESEDFKEEQKRQREVTEQFIAEAEAISKTADELQRLRMKKAGVKEDDIDFIMRERHTNELKKQVMEDEERNREHAVAITNQLASAEEKFMARVNELSGLNLDPETYKRGIQEAEKEFASAQRRKKVGNFEDNAVVQKDSAEFRKLLHQVQEEQFSTQFNPFTDISKQTLDQGKENAARFDQMIELLGRLVEINEDEGLDPDRMVTLLPVGVA